MKLEFTNWEVSAIIKGVKRLKEEELKNFKENKNMRDSSTQKAYWEISMAFDELIRKLETKAKGRIKLEDRIKIPSEEITLAPKSCNSALIKFSMFTIKGKSFIVGTTYKPEFSDEENRKRTQDFFVNHVEPFNLCLLLLKRYYVKDFEKPELYKEVSFIIVGEDKKDEEKLRKLAFILLCDYNQDQVLWRETNSNKIFLLTKEEDKVIAEESNISFSTIKNVWANVRGKDFLFEKVSEEFCLRKISGWIGSFARHVTYERIEEFQKY